MENLNCEPPLVASAVPVAVAEVLAPVVVPRGLCTRSRLHLRAVQMNTTWKKKALAPAAEHLGKAPRHAGKARWRLIQIAGKHAFKQLSLNAKRAWFVAAQTGTQRKRELEHASGRAE